MRYLVAAALTIAGVIHLLPLSGVLSAERLSALYGVAVEGPDLVILMRHRAVLFGLVGGFMVYAAFRPALQPLAFAVGLMAAGSFLYFAWEIGGYNARIARVVAADVVAVASLLIGAIARILETRSA